MQVSYYQNPSEIGAPIIALLDIEIVGDCISTIEHCEQVHRWRYCECQILRYLWRLGVKTVDIKSDCQKILDYCDRVIENESPLSINIRAVRSIVRHLLDNV
jgi:hypothetical protein